jgi:hypothetical protein
MKTFAAALIAALALAAPASADKTDDFFVKVLTDEGIGKGIPPAQLIHLGHTICSDLGNGISMKDEANGLFKSGIGAHDAGALIGASVGAYCPQHSSEVEKP